MYITGLDGQARRMYTYSEATGYGPLNMLSFFGAAVWQLVFLLLCITFTRVFKIRHEILVADPWDARSLEWATLHQYQNITLRFCHKLIQVEAFWDSKKKGHELFTGEIKDIHMPNNSGVPFIMGIIFFIGGSALVFSIMDP